MLRLRSAHETPAPTPEPPLPATVGGATITPLFPGLRPLALPLQLTRQIPSLRALSFIVVVLLPVAVTAIYEFAIAADQYVAEFRMTLRTADAQRVEAVALFASGVAQANVVSESQVVTQFIASRAIVDELDPKLDLRHMFAPSAADWWARLSLPASIEQLVY